MPTVTHEQPSSDGIGELVLAETLLGDLVEDILRALGGDPVRSTRRAAEEIKDYLDGELDDQAMRNWLSDVKGAASKRHAIVHALARDRCKTCGQANHFTYEGREVDRSAATIQALADTIDSLIRLGLDLARDLNCRIRDRAAKRAKTEANHTGNQVSLSIQYVNLNHFECADCRGADQGMRTVEVGKVVEASPNPRWRAEANELPPRDDASAKT